MTGTLDDHDVALVDAGHRHPVDGIGQWLEKGELLGRAVVGDRQQAGAGEDLHVLAVAAPEPDLPVAGHVRVAVEAERVHGQDLIDHHPLALGDAEIGVGRQLDDPPHRLVPGHHGKGAAPRHQLDPVELGHVAPAQSDRLDGEYGAARRRLRDRKVTDLEGAIAQKHRGPAGPSHRHVLSVPLGRLSRTSATRASAGPRS